MDPNQALWEKGDFTRVAESVRDSDTAFVASLAITGGMKVRDLGCGDGTTALLAALPGADVLGVDIASNLVAAGLATQATFVTSPTPASTSSSRCSGRCSRRDRSMSRRRSSA